MCIYRYPRTGLILYASTEIILKGALRTLNLPLEPPEEPGLSGEEPRLPALSWEPLSGSSPPPEEPPWDWEDSTSPGQAVTSWGGSLPISIRAQARERAAVAREAFLAAPLFFQNWNFIFTSLSVAGVFPVSAENGAVKMVTAREAWDKAKLLAEKTAHSSCRRWKDAAIGPRPLEKGRQQALLGGAAGTAVAGWEDGGRNASWWRPWREKAFPPLPGNIPPGDCQR